MKETRLRKIIMISIIMILAILNVFLLTIQIVNAEEEKTTYVKPIIEGAMEKYINYNISDYDKGTLVQYHLRTGIHYEENSELFPIKENEVIVNMPQIDGKYPYYVKVVVNNTEATNANDKDNHMALYDPETGIVTIKIYNQDENGNLISSQIPNQDSRDDYTVISYYDTYTEEQPEREIDLKISSRTKLYADDNRETYGEGELKRTVTENIGDLTSIRYDTEDIYNGYIKSNIINGTEYNTQYTEREQINISKKEAQQKIQIAEENTFVKTNGEEIIRDLGNQHQLVYKSTKLNKENITEILGEEGIVEILDADGNILATVDKNTEFAEDGTFTITYANEIENIIIKTSQVINEGTLYIENTKEIKNTMENLENVKIKTTTNIIGIIEEEVLGESEEETENATEEKQIIETESYKVVDENIIEIKDAQTNVSLDLDTQELTNEQQNEVTFKVKLQANNHADNMFKDPTIKIELPNQVEKVILKESAIMYANGLTLNEPYTEVSENGNIDIIANLEGIQSQYNENNLGLTTTIEIKAIVILKNEIKDSTENINLTYTNGWTLDGTTEENTSSKEIQIKSYQNIEPVEEENEVIVPYSSNDLSTEDMEGLNLEVVPLRGNKEINDGDIIYEGEYIKYNITVTNTTDKDLANVNINATIPEGLKYGELETDYDNFRSEYKYNFDVGLREKQIDIGTIKSGESKTVFYEVQANNLTDVEEKQVMTDIRVNVDNQQAKNWEMTNTIKKADVQVFLTASKDYRGLSGWNYGVNLSSLEEKQVPVKIYLPKQFELDCVVYDGGKIDLDMDISEDNVITTTLNSNGSYSFQGYIYQTDVDKEDGKGAAELTAFAEVITDNTYTSNQNRIMVQYENVTISMTSPNEGEEVRYGEEIKYEVEIKNVGGKNVDYDQADYIIVEITDFLPDDFNATSITYNTWKLDDNLQIISEDTITKEIGGIHTDDNGERLPSIDEFILIPSGETSTITINGTAGHVYEKTTINNAMTVSGDDIEAKTSNTVTHTILPYNYDQINDNPDNPENPDDPNTPENPDNPNNPNTPGDINDPNSRYSISGIAWNDQNGDGERQTDEGLLSQIEVMLIDTNNANTVKSTVRTNNSGAYTFSGLEQGNYIVIFRYNTNDYTVTQYQASGVTQNLNSDAMDSLITLDGNQVTVGVTDVITLDSDMANIDIGLIERKICDFRLDKYISKVTVRTNKGVVEEERYNNQKLAKAEIHSKQIDGATVIVEYKIVVTNEGESAGNVTQVIDYLPDGLDFSSELNTNWALSGSGKLVNLSIANREIQPGENVQLTLVLTKEMTQNSTGTFTNAAEIGSISNNQGTMDTDSIPGNGANAEDDYSTADLIITVGTGAVVYISIAIGLLVVMIIICYIIIKKKHIDIRKILKISRTIAFVLVFGTIIFSQQIVDAYYYEQDYYFKYIVYESGPSHLFEGGPTGYGQCMNHDAEAYNTTFSYGGTVKGDDTYSEATSSSTTEFNLTKGNTTVSTKAQGDNYIIGPFSVSCTIYGTYSFNAYDSNGNEITGFSTCDSNGNTITVRGNMQFYIKMAQSKLQNGISKLKLSATRTVTTTVTKKKYVRPWYKCPDFPGQKVGQDVQAHQRVYQKDEQTSTPENITKSLEWTDFKASLEIIKQDADDATVTLSGVQIRVQNSAIKYDKTFTTDANGKIRIDNLQIGTYTLTEVSNDHYGYIQLENATVNLASGQVVKYSLLNEKDTGNLRIEKKDADNDTTKIEGVSFRVRKRLSADDEEALADFVDGKGDVSGNGYLEEEDVKMVLRYVTEKVDLTEEQLEQADVNGDGQVDVADIRLLTRKIQTAEYVVGMQKDSSGNLTPIETATGNVHFDSMETTNNPEEATTFVTNAEGIIQIYDILTGSYVVEEISVGNNFGYDLDPNFISWEITNSDGTTSTVEQSVSAAIEVTKQESTDTNNTATQNGTGKADKIVDKNRRKFIKIRGFAWEEKTDGKNSTKDYTWNDGTEDKKLANVIVRLKDVNGIELAQTMTDSNGEYVFGNYDEDPNAIKLEIDDLVGAYIEFEYNGMSYQSIEVNSKFTENSETTSNGNTITKYSGNTNKATDSALRDEYNDNYATISKNTSSDTNGNVTYEDEPIEYNYDSNDHKSAVIYGDEDKVLKGYPEQPYPISGTDKRYTLQAVTAQSETNALCTDLTPEMIRQKSVVEIGGLNLGVEERAMPDLAIVQDMEQVQISLNGYTHTYQYARRFDDANEYAGGDPFDTTVKFANKYIENSYSREVYSSDVSYNSQNEESMQVYITYMVALRNESADVSSSIKTLSNYYDERYENVLVRDDTFVRNDNGVITEYGKEISYQPDNSYNENNMKKVDIYADYQIEPSQTRYLTITYELSNEAINSLLNDNEITLDSVTEITSYSTYYRDSQFTQPYAGIDKDSAPDTVDIQLQDGKISIQDTMEDDTDKAPTLKIVPKEGRIIEGTVWEDRALQDLLELSGYDKERKGDGKYQDGSDGEEPENVVEKVTVELMRRTDSNIWDVAELYKKDGSSVPASTSTDPTGHYTFSGVIPDPNYLLRFTYDNNSVIVDPAGNTVGNINIDNYKSTIYRGGEKEDPNSHWYREETSKFADAERLSDAKDTSGKKEDGTVIPDIVGTRIHDEEEFNYETVTENRNLASISADTATFEIELDYDVNDINLEHISKYDNQLVFVFDHMDFGIIERPRQELEVDKQVANIQITLANGTTLINGDPRTQNLSGVRVLDNHDVYIEMDNELIQGSTLEVTYEISVDNTRCEIDYNDEDYYIYGIVPANKMDVYKIATVKDMYDYLPSELIFQKDAESHWDKVAIQASDKGTILSDEVYEKVKGLQNIVHLDNNAAFATQTPGTKVVDTTLVVSKQLSTSSDDLTYENDVEIIKLSSRPLYNSVPGNYDPTTNTPEELDDGNVSVTITAPTGENRQYLLYGGLGIGLLIIIGIGVVIIKKKVL